MLGEALTQSISGPVRGAMIMTAGLTVGERALVFLSSRQLGVLLDKLVDFPGPRQMPVLEITLTLTLRILTSNCGIPYAVRRAKLSLQQTFYRGLATNTVRHVLTLGPDFLAKGDSTEVAASLEKGCEAHELPEIALGDGFALVVDAIGVMYTIGCALGTSDACIIAFACITSLGISLMAMPTFAKSKAAYYERFREAVRVKSEPLHKWPLVVAHCTEIHEAARAEESIRAYQALERAHFALAKAINLCGTIVMHVAIGSILVSAAQQVISEGGHAGKFLHLLDCCNIVESRVCEATAMIKKVIDLGVKAEQITPLLATHARVTDKADARDLVRTCGEVRFDDVTFGYSTEEVLLRGITFTASSGKTLALVGRSGSGKSTVARLLQRFHDVCSGTISIDGQDIRDVTIQSLRRAVDVMHQDPLFFRMTIWENLVYGLDATETWLPRMIAVCKQVLIHDKITQLAEGYHALLTTDTFSGGELQRLSLARVLLADAPIVVLDEPTSALDVATEASLLQNLKETMQGKTVIIIAHRLSTIQHADEILLLDGGLVIERGTHSELLQSRGRYARLWGLATGQALDDDTLDGKQHETTELSGLPGLRI